MTNGQIQAKGSDDYARQVYAQQDISQPRYLPETRYAIVGYRAWNSQKPYSGATDRLWSGGQKVSAWEGPAAISTLKTTGYSLTAGYNANPNLNVTYRTPRALLDSQQGLYLNPIGNVQSDQIYANVGGANQAKAGVISRFLKALAGAQ